MVLTWNRSGTGNGFFIKDFDAEQVNAALDELMDDLPQDAGVLFFEMNLGINDIIFLQGLTHNIFIL